MSTREELSGYLRQIESDDVWVSDILDAHATESVKAVAEYLQQAWDKGEFFIHEVDGAYAALEFLKGLVVAYGKIESTPKAGSPAADA